MPSITYWNRLEPRARSGDLTETLAARVRDPAWFLTRQWQLGEFRGEDAGTPAYVTVDALVSRFVGWRAPSDTETQLLEDGDPMEPAALSEPVAGDLSTAVDLGQWFERILVEEGLLAYIPDWQAAFPIEDASDDDPRAARMRALWKGRVIDGNALYAIRLLHQPAPPARPLGIPDTVPSEHWEAASTALASFVALVGEVFPGGLFLVDPKAWQPERLDFSLQAYVAQPNVGELEIETDLAFLPWGSDYGWAMTVADGASYTISCYLNAALIQSVTVSVSAGNYTADALAIEMSTQLEAFNNDIVAGWLWDRTGYRGKLGLQITRSPNTNWTWILKTADADGDAFVAKLGFSAPSGGYPKTISDGPFDTSRIVGPNYPDSRDVVRIPAGGYAASALAQLIQDQLDLVTAGGAAWTFEWVDADPPFRARLNATGGGDWSFVNYPTFGATGFTSRFGYEVETGTGGVYDQTDAAELESDTDIDSTTSGAATMKALRAQPDAEGHLDWYAFDGSDEAVPEDVPEASVDTVTRTVIPNYVRFRGMPNARFWDFEDGRVDFGALRPDRRDLLSMVLMDFMLIHGNDWFVIPFEQPVGTRTRISELVVVDVFGVERVVSAVEDIEPSATGEKRWTMFSTKTGSSVGAGLIIPATVASNVLDGETVEEVRFLRDETANLAWAIERSTPDRLGRPWLGHERSVAAAEQQQVYGSAPLRYRLQTTVPSNWIPFQAVKSGENASDPTALERAQLLGPEGVVNPLPLGKVLNPQNVAPYRIREEELPREGRRVSRLARWARDVDGRGHLWMSRKRSIGTGEGWSGLRFDLAAPATVTTMTWDALPGWDDGNWG